MNNSKKVLIIGHAGGKKSEPENTLKAFRKAIQLKADFIELDVRMSKDKEIIIFHDADTNEITKVPGLVKDKTLKELKLLDVGEGERIPTFREVLEVTKNKIQLLLHIASANMENSIINLLREYDYLEMTVVSCMIHKYLLKFRALEPKLKLASLENPYHEGFLRWDIRKKLIDKAIENQFYSINPEYHLVDDKFVNYAHKRNLIIFPWTVNDRKDIQALINQGVDGIITDDILLLKEILKI